MDLVIFVNPITEKIEQMPLQMVCAYVPYVSYLDLETAAKVAAIRDEEAATNLLLSAAERYSVSVSEGCELDILAIEPPSLR